MWTIVHKGPAVLRFLKLTAIVVLGVVVTSAAALYLASRSYTSQAESPARSRGGTAAATSPTEGPHGEGRFGPYRFTYMSRDNTYVAIFTPFLAHDDDTLVGAIRAVALTTYAVDIGGTSPSVVGREIAFRLPGATYYVLPVKDETSGQVHSIVVRRTN